MGLGFRRTVDHAELDDPRTTASRRQIIREKRLLRDIYHDWYTAIADALPAGDDPILELGSGAGFMKTEIDRLFSSTFFRSQSSISSWMRVTFRWPMRRCAPLS